MAVAAAAEPPRGCCWCTRAHPHPMHDEFRPKLCAPHPGAVHIQSPWRNAVARGAGGLVESVNPRDALLFAVAVVIVVVDGLFGVHVPVLALCALVGLAARGLGYAFVYGEGEDGNCPRECKSPIEAVARRTPILDKSAMSSIIAAAGSKWESGGWSRGLRWGTVGVLVLLLPSGSSCWSGWSSSLGDESTSEARGEPGCMRRRGFWRGGVGVGVVCEKGRIGMDGKGWCA